ESCEMINESCLGAFSARHGRNRPTRRRMKGIHCLLLIIVALEDCNQLSDLQQISNALREIGQLDVATRVTRCGEKTDQSTDTAAIDVTDFAKVQNNTIVVSQLALNRLPQVTGFVAKDNASDAIDNLDTVHSARRDF